MLPTTKNARVARTEFGIGIGSGIHQRAHTLYLIKLEARSKMNEIYYKI